MIKIYGVSRETIRKALNLLTTEGYIQKKQGKGSIVLDRNRFDFPIAGLTSYKELQENQHIPSETIVQTLEETVVDKELHKVTGWPIDTPVWHLVRQRKNQWRSRHFRSGLFIKRNRTYFDQGTSKQLDL